MQSSLFPDVPKQYHPYGVEDIIRFSDPIPGWMTENERRWLHQTARRLLWVDDRPPIWVEIGTNIGRSMLATICSLPNSSVFITIDTYMGSYVTDRTKAEGMSKLVDPGITFNDVYHTAIHLRPDIKIITIRQTSEQALQWVADGSVSVVFIDGNHDYPAVASDINGWKKKLHHTGLLCGHDYLPEFPGVMQAVHEIDRLPTRGGYSIWATTKFNKPSICPLLVSHVDP